MIQQRAVAPARHDPSIRALPCRDFALAAASQSEALSGSAALIEGVKPSTVLMRLLRAERRRRGGAGYDLVRHIALVRSLRRARAAAQTTRPPR